MATTFAEIIQSETITLKKKQPSYNKLNALKYFVYLLFATFIFTASCKNSVKQESNTSKNIITDDEHAKHDTASIYLDSLQITKYLQQNSLNESYRENLESFYKKRNEEFAWINNAGINEYARNFINLLNQEENKAKNDSLFYHDKLHSLYNLISQDDYKFNSKDTLVTQLELLLTENFFAYAEGKWGGISNEESKKVSWFIERKKLNYKNLLDTLLKNNANSISSFEPVYHQYGLLKIYLQKYRDIEKKGGWIAWNDGFNKFKKGDTSSVITSIREQLYMLEDLSVNDSTNIFEDKLEEAVKKFQKRNGLKEDGIISGKTLLAMSIPIHELIQQLLINMERCKWVPVEQKGDYLAVNIPAFKLLVYHNDTLQWSCNAIVGKSRVANNTVIFNDNLEYIVFSPFWNIPREIIFKETLPEMKRNSNYLANHNMEVVNTEGQPVAASSIEWNKYSNNFPYIIRQKPGKNNTLGLVKFLFPNSYDIYMHDTPEKYLFAESTRMFSHGCIRLQEPFKLAKFLLREDSSFTDEKIITLMNGGKQTFVKLKNKVPVFIAYFTAWVDRDGKLNFRDDVYHHDEKMKHLLFKD